MDVETAFHEAKGLADAVLVLPSPILNTHRIRVVELAAKHRLPAVYHIPEFAEDGD